ncbi:MAG: HYR domain-containing protein [Flavobacteriales bacterium]|nr:HYR domain-containing protein [Flavobacteriales bacterium]
MKKLLLLLFIFLFGSQITNAQIAITEFITNPIGNDVTDEWVEIHNFGSTSIDIQNWRIKDEDADNDVITNVSFNITAGGYVIIASSKISFEEQWFGGCSQGMVLEVPGLTLANGTDEIIIEDSNGNIIWSLAYANDEVEGIAVHYTEAPTFTNNIWGSKASPGIDRSGNDPATSTLGYENNSVTPDILAITSTTGDIGSPLNGTGGDTELPVISDCSPNVFGNLYLSNTGIATFYADSANITDNCSLATKEVKPFTGSTWGNSLNFNCTTGFQQFWVKGTDTSGNTDSCIYVVNILDTIAPTAVCQDIDVYLDGTGTVIVTASELDGGSTEVCPFTIASSTINGNPSKTYTCLDLGSQQATLEVYDISGNSKTCSATITVTDTTAPTASCQNITVYLDGSGNATIVAADINNGSSDNCGTVTLSASPTTFTCANLGSNSVNLTVTDGSGNSSMCTATVTVSDTIPPVINCLGNQTEIATLACQITLADYTGVAGVFATDNCTALPQITQSPVAGTTISGAGTVQTVTLTATDASGNTANCTFDVTVVDNTNPTITCPGNQTASVNGSCSFSLPDYTGLAIATDN